MDIYPQKIAMKMILLYFLMCGLQGIVTAIVLVFANRNEIQVQKELKHSMSELRVSDQQRTHIRK